MNRTARLALSFLAIGALVAAAACSENLPSSPPTFPATVQAPAAATLHVGQSLAVTAKATDAAGREILALRFTWASSDPATVAVDTTSSSGQVAVLTAKKAGTARVTLTLPDSRFSSAPATIVVTVIP
jgi:uncharacterized protein YjdB